MSCGGEGCGVDVLKAVGDGLLTLDVVIIVVIICGDEFTRVATGETTAVRGGGWSDYFVFVRNVATFTDGEKDFGLGGVVGVGFGALVEGVVLWRDVILSVCINKIILVQVN